MPNLKWSTLPTILMASGALFAFAGCKEIKITDGEIPAKYLPVASKYLGTYSGTMRGNSGQLTLALHGTKAVVAYENQYGRDLLDPKCHSQVGPLLGVQVSADGKGGYELDAARFAFDPGVCALAVQGRELNLAFKTTKRGVKVTATILLDQNLERRCRIDGGNPAAGVPPREVCDVQPTDRVSTGQFLR
jgi:hypothetical protein